MSWYPFFGSLGFLNEALSLPLSREAVLLALLDVLVFGVYLWAMSVVFICIVLVPVNGLPVLLWMQDGNAMDALFLDFGKALVGMVVLIVLVGFWTELGRKEQG